MAFIVESKSRVSVRELFSVFVPKQLQLLHQSAFRDSDDEVTSNKGSRINNQTEKDDQRIERDEIHHNHKKILPTTFTTRHNPII